MGLCLHLPLQLRAIPSSEAEQFVHDEVVIAAGCGFTAPLEQVNGALEGLAEDFVEAEIAVDQLKLTVSFQGSQRHQQLGYRMLEGRNQRLLIHSFRCHQGAGP